MDSVKPSALTSKKSRFARNVAKVLHLRAATGIAPVDGVQKVVSQEEVKDDKHHRKTAAGRTQSFDIDDHRKTAYSQLQYAQSPYDADGIQAADQFEQKSLSKTYEIMGKKLESQLRLKEAEIMNLREKMEESIRQNRLLENRLGSRRRSQIYRL
ncbi:hypothetical protein OIU85_002401 [Salix viminalis]|uniref:DUF641 domain-containing protein n=1 Tax=Salix viminalis TaxID=40686 RepID=A0A9Q0ZYU4_SALVM|nr:hypothetical protein OIU85_002401 [Salix viminalis]